ncbi:hypothetical protein [Methylobacterium sp. E-066]|uniref:hypothetical protein n=1 Tax=Methylobacterium sp. E-066 TaxID=2836584 RepID=UPI001FB955B1|nr:hypothetical protein [Methylobacterium sp. E-066]MCJ2142152.1 hypothetical protein [Methylobacterium sp. E-066]
MLTAGSIINSTSTFLRHHALVGQVPIFHARRRFHFDGGGLAGVDAAKSKGVLETSCSALGCRSDLPLRRNTTGQQHLRRKRPPIMFELAFTVAYSAGAFVAVGVILRGLAA